MIDPVFQEAIQKFTGKTEVTFGDPSFTLDDIAKRLAKYIADLQPVYDALVAQMPPDVEPDAGLVASNNERTAIEGEITSLEGEVSALEGSFSALNAQIDEAQASVQ